MQGINEVRLSGQVSKVYPVKHFDQQNCMLIAEITTTDEAGTFTHRVSFLNTDAISFAKNVQLGAMVNIDAKLTPRPKNKNNPDGETFFEIRCVRYVFVAESVIQPVDAAAVYPESIDSKPVAPSLLQRMFKNFNPHKQVQPQAAQEEKTVVYSRPKTFCADTNYSYKRG